MVKGRDLLIYLSVTYEGDWHKIFDAIKRKEKNFTVDDVDQAVTSVKAKTTTLLDDDYPEILKKCHYPPFVLYYYGDLNLIDENKSLAVVGSRNSSPYGEEMTRKIVSVVAKKFTIVSGLARGIDSLAEQTAIDVGGKTIAILGSGIDYCYPKENWQLYEEIKKHHLLVSEYPNLTKPNKEHFPMRNRLIAYFSNSLFMAEGSTKSGSFITVSYALDKGSDIFCLPHEANKNSGCNKLIKEGATLVESGEEILQYYDL